MFLVSEAIVIGRRTFANTSLVLKCYTERAGGMTVLAKGAFRRRRRAEPPSVPDLFERGEVVLSFIPTKGYSILVEWTLEDVRSNLRRRLDAFGAACGCAALVAAIPGEPSPGGEHFQALEEALGELDRGGAARPILWAFALKLFSKAGFLAPLETCAICGSRSGAVATAGPAGGLVCRRCVPDVPDAVELPAEALSMARFLERAAMSAAGKIRCSPRASVALDRMVQMLAEHFLERQMPELAPLEG